MELDPGHHYFKFIIDGEWKYDPTKPFLTDSFGNINNVLDITEAEEQSGDVFPPKASIIDKAVASSLLLFVIVHCVMSVRSLKLSTSTSYLIV